MLRPALNLNRLFNWCLTMSLAAVLAGCANGPQPLKDSEKASLVPSGQVQDNVRVIKVEAQKFVFIPNTIVVVSGEQVRLEVTSTDVTHGIAIPALNIDRKLEPNRTEIITFTAGAEGSYPFHCSVFCGLGHFGMNGRLEILPAGR